MRIRFLDVLPTKSHVVNVEEAGSGSTLDRVVGGCPEATIVMMGAEVRCLLDTGAQVFTATKY